MGRKLGTNVYSNNFEPQVMGLLDARTQVDTKADLTKDATWTSTDGNTYAPVGIRVSVTDDSTNGNNGVYMLMSEDYAIASNWMQINSSSGGGGTDPVMVDLSFINAIPGTYVPDRYLMGEFRKIQDALSIDTPFFVYQFSGEFGQFPASATINGDTFELSILYRDEVWFVNFDGIQYTTSKGGTSPLTNVKVLTTSGLLNTSRKGYLYLSSSDVTIWKNIELGRDIIVYSGSIAQEKQYVPLSISSNGTGSAQVGRVTYMLNGSMYSFRIEYVNPSAYTAGEVYRVEGTGGGGIEKISIPFDTIYNLAVNSSTTSADIIAGIGQDKLDKLCDFTLPLNIELTNYYGSGSIYSKKDFMMGDSSALAVAIYGLNNQSFVLNNNDGVYSLSKFNQINFDIDINDFSTNAPQSKTVAAALKAKQKTLVSGTNIKTINGQSILGSGNIDISGGSGASELHDLSIDVKTGRDAAGDPKIYFRIREIVPNGRIHFVRKKRTKYKPMGTSTYHKRVTYAPMFLDVRTVKDTGMDVSNLMENTWYEFPIKADDLIGSYPAGSNIEGSMNKRVYDTIRFKGNVHAKSLVYDTPSLTKNLTVLQAGLQYNVLTGSRAPLFKERGEIVKIDVRLRAKSPTNYNLGYEYNYAVK